MKIYLATSWRNEHYPRVLKLLRDEGYDVYDYREKGFLFSNITDKPVDDLPAQEQAALLKHDTSVKAFHLDRMALIECDALVMLYPCGNDAHVELGFAAADGKCTVVYVVEGYRVGLMDLVADKFVFNDQELLEALK